MYRLISFVAGLLLAAAPLQAQAQKPAPQTQKPEAQKPFEPQVGQAGKDVVWVPSSMEVVEKMLDMAKVTPQDLVMDLGSGDGRNIIAAAKRGARGVGVEYNPDMVELSKRRAAEAGVADKAQFVQGDMYEADISKASVLALFLLPHNLERLRDKFLALKPGSRIVANTYAIPNWDADVTETIDGDCQTWCTSLLYFVPANAAGTWQTPQGQLTLTQQVQSVSGTIASGGGAPTSVAGKLRGEEITFSAGATEYRGRITGDRIDGTTNTGQKFSFTRVRK